MLVLDLLQNPHKLEVERIEALEYRKKFYPASGYLGSGAGSVGSSGMGGGGYTPTALPSNYGGSNDASKVYRPYNEETGGSSGGYGNSSASSASN